MKTRDVLGEGRSSICRKATCNKTGATVVVKTYKPRDKKSTELMFRRQVEVLQALALPFEQPDDPRFWHPDLKDADPSDFFMALIDFSMDATGAPSLDPVHKCYFVVTEFAQYSLKDYVRHSVDSQTVNDVQSMAVAILRVVSALHAKGFVHLDLKPANLMLFNGKLKLIDVDGCVLVGCSNKTSSPQSGHSLRAEIHQLGLH